MRKYKYRIIGDTHIDEDCFTETEHIFSEILHDEAEHTIFLGDIFHKHNPTPREINFVLKWFSRFTMNSKEVTVILGNHDVYAGYQTTCLLKYIGIDVVKHNIMTLPTSIGTIFCGHFFVNESIDNYNDNPKSIADFSANAKYVFLGHQHRFQKLTHNAWHVGSTRYVGFGEYDTKLIPKKIGLIDHQGELTFKDLKTPYPLKQFSCVKEMYEYYAGRKIDTVIYDKIRLKYTSFDTYKKDINKLEPILLPLYYPIKIKLDFVNKQLVKSYDTEIKPKQVSTKQIVGKWLDSIKDKDVKEILKKESSTLCD